MTRAIPLISVFAAFSFVVMMFNVPLPGGTTGHAVGVAVAAIVLGPCGSILAVSIAIVLQALFFGDGGITTLGANCFNMAIAGSLVAFWVYRLVAGDSESSSRRRVIGAGIAGYLSINAAALLTAIEFGIQPILFRDATGTPLYAPYGLKVAIPAMMLGHLTFAGLAEAVLSAGMISYLQRADIGLLRGVAGPVREVGSTSVQGFQKRLWTSVALLMLLTPLGTLAVGAAWGEWSAAEVAAQQASASAPAGLERLSEFWTAPFPAYAPAFIKRPEVGYLLSAMFGVGLLGLASIAARSAGKRNQRRELRS